MTTTTEVFFHRLRPKQWVARRDARPVAWLPIGTLEWHGHHLPMGTDTLQSEHMAKLCAERGGGVAFPPLHYGEPRLTDHMDYNCEPVAAEYGLTNADFRDPRRWPVDQATEIAAYNQLLIRTLAQIQSYGFRLAVIVVGHYPLIDHARAAAMHFNHFIRGHRPEGFTPMSAYACIDFLLVRDQWPRSGDHAGGWETSHIMASHPQLVDLDELPPEGEALIGAGGAMPPQRSTAAFGTETMDAAVAAALKEADDRLARPGLYNGHGISQQEGLWRRDDRD